MNFGLHCTPGQQRRSGMAISMSLFDDDICTTAQVCALMTGTRVGHGINALSSSISGQTCTSTVFTAAHQGSALAQAANKINEDLLKSFARTIAIQVIRFDIGDNLDPWSVVEEGAIGFIGFGNENISAAQVGTRAQLRNHCTDCNRGIFTSIAKCHREHR